MKIFDIKESSMEFSAKKYTFLSNDKFVGFSYIKRYKKHIICVSCEYGCSNNCPICSSGNSYYGPLTNKEMISGIERIIENEDIKGCKLLISFMGSGDPLSNISHVINTIKYFQENKHVRFAISISGYYSCLLKRLTVENDIIYKKLKMQLSLHSADDKIRKNIIPHTDLLEEIHTNLKEYSEDSSGDIEINYVVLDRINDSNKDADKLALLIKRWGYPLKINEYHQVNDTIRESKRKKAFLQRLRDKGVKFECYVTNGVDIGAACGQLQSRKV